LRRLLDTSYTLRGGQGIQHYLIRKKYDRNDYEKYLRKILEENENLFEQKVAEQLKLDRTVTVLMNFMEILEERDAESFGVGVIWVEDHTDVPGILERIRKGGRVK
jgi:hypothetical protein